MNKKEFEVNVIEASLALNQIVSSIMGPINKKEVYFMSAALRLMAQLLIFRIENNLTDKDRIDRKDIQLELDFLWSEVEDKF